MIHMFGNSVSWEMLHHYVVDMHLKVVNIKKMAHQLLEYQIFFRMVQLGLILHVMMIWRMMKIYPLEMVTHLFAQLKSFTQYEDSMLDDYGITEEEYDKYAGVYKNALEEIKLAEAEDDSDKEHQEDDTVDLDYELMAYSSTKIDYEYIINLIQNIVTPSEEAEVITPEERQKQIEEVKQYVEEMQKDNPKVAEIMLQLINEIAQDENKYKGQSILNIVENMKLDCINKVISDFCVTWYASKDDVMYAALHYRNGEIPNESVIKATIDYQSYKDVHEKALPKFRYYTQCMAELRKTLDEEIKPLLTIAG